MWFRLAARLGMSVRRCQEEIDAREFVEWIAYDKMEPIGDRRADYRTALIAKVIADVNRKRGSSAYRLDDFLLQWGGPQTIDPDRRAEVMRAWAAMHNAMIKRSG